MKHRMRSVFGKWVFSTVQCCNTSWHRMDHFFTSIA